MDMFGWNIITPFNCCEKMKQRKNSIVAKVNNHRDAIGRADGSDIQAGVLVGQDITSFTDDTEVIRVRVPRGNRNYHIER
jgi:hypothetical protein